MTTEELLLKINGDASGAQGALKNLGSSFEGLFGTITEGVAAGALLSSAIEKIGSVALGAIQEAASALPDLIEHAMTVGNSIYEMSLKTGGSVETLSKLRYVASQTGIDFESFGDSLFKMEKFLGSTGEAADKAQETLGRLGLNLRTLKNEKPDEAFIDILSALEQIPNRADQAAAGATIFGKGFKNMAGLAAENIRELLDQAEKLGLVMSTETAAAAHAAEIGFKAFGMQIESVGLRIGAAFMPAVIGLEQNIGQVLRSALDSTNKSLDTMGGSGGFLATVARAMGTGNTAIAAQVQLYETLRDTIISLVRNAVEPSITAFSYVMEGWDAVNVLSHMVVAGYQGITYEIERFLLASIRVTQFTDPLNAKGYEAEAASITKDLDRLYNAMASNDAAIQRLKRSEQDWADGAKIANQAIEGGLKTLGATHTDVAGIIQHFADLSRNAYGGVGADVDTANKAAGEFAQSLKKLTETLDAAAAHGLPISEQVKLYGEAAAKAAEEAKGWGVTVGKSVQDVADAYNAKKLSDVVAKDGDMIRRLYDRLMADVAERLKKGLADTNNAWESNQSELIKVQEEYQRLLAENEGDSLEGRLAAVHHHFDQVRAALKDLASNYPPIMAEIGAIEAATAQDATEKWDVHFQELKRAANTIPNVFADAMGDVPRLIENIFAGRSITQAVAGFASSIASSLGRSLFSAGGLLSGLANSAASGLTKMLGDTVGGALANVIPGIGGALGALVGPLFNKIFGTAGRDAVDKFAQTFADPGLNNGFDNLHAKLSALGAQGETLWRQFTQGVGRNDPAAAKRAIDAITAAFDQQKKTAEALSAAMAPVNSELADLLKQAQGLGAADLLQPYLDKLADAKGLTADNLSLLQQLGGDGTVSFEQMQKAASALGISTDHLGQSFQNAKAQADWQSIIDNVDTLVRGGANLNDLLGDDGLQKKINDLVVSSLKFGTTIPENAKPWVEQLAREGKLLDENGNKITDTSKLTFGESLQTSLQKLIDKIGILLDKIGNIPGALDKIPAQKDIIFNGKKTGDWPDGSDTGDTGDTVGRAATGAYVTSGGLVPLRFTAGGLVPSSFLASRGAYPDTVPAFVSPGELILNAIQQGRLASALTRPAAGGVTFGEGAVQIVIDRPILKDRDSINELGSAIGLQLKEALSPLGLW